MLDADIRGFFDAIDHGWLCKFLEHRIADRRILRLIQQWLRAGVSEDGQWTKTEVGTPQGAVASPLLANVFLHYVFDLWVQQWRTKFATGDMIVVRYADDFVVGFQHRREAERFLRELEGRLREVRPGLAPRENATDRIRAVRRREPTEARGAQAGDLHVPGLHPHLWAEALERRVYREAEDGDQAAPSQAARGEARADASASRADPEQGKWLRGVVQGYFNYHGVPGNMAALDAFRTETTR